MRSSTASSARLVAMPLRWFSRQIIRLYAQKRMGKDTVGELKSAEICVSHMPSLKAKKLGKLPREKVLLELAAGKSSQGGSMRMTALGIMVLLVCCATLYAQQRTIY